MDIAGKTFLVTGGSSGLGEATVRTLVESGGHAVIADVGVEAGEGLARELGECARFVVCDVTDASSVEKAVRAAFDAFGGLHGAISCAGVGAAMKVVGSKGPHSADLFSAILNVNLVGTFNVIRLAAFAMSQTRPTETGERGVLINTASVAAFDGQIGQAAYSASKGGVMAMTLPIARELGRHGIRVVTIAPGTFDTPMLAMLPQEVRDTLALQVPYPSRLGRPSEFAALVKHIIENEMINGETIRLDGALRMGPK